MKISKKLIFLAVVLIIVSIISMYFGSVTTVEGATVTCPDGATSSTSTDATGNVTFSCSSDTATTTTATTTTPAAASCTGIVCALKPSDCKSKLSYSNQACCASQATKKTACNP